MNHENPTQAYAKALEAQEDRLWEEEDKRNAIADKLVEESTRQDGVREELRDVVRKSLGGHAPSGYTNSWKVDAIAEIIERKGIRDRDGARRVVGNLLSQARSHVKARHYSDLDKVYISVRGGQLR